MAHAFVQERQQHQQVSGLPGAQTFGVMGTHIPLRPSPPLTRAGLPLHIAHRSYNKLQEDFASKQEWDDYLEQIEDIS